MRNRLNLPELLQALIRLPHFDLLFMPSREGVVVVDVGLGDGGGQVLHHAFSIQIPSELKHGDPARWERLMNVIAQRLNLRFCTSSESS
jgi:hypothetical protein